MSLLTKTVQFADIEKAWKADALDVKKVAPYLTSVIGSIRQPFVISLNAPYGTGKTFFIRNWQKDLIDQGFKAVYFNAWETDYTDNALVAFISSIDDQLRDGVSKAASLIKAGAAYIAQKGLTMLAKGIARKCVGDETVKEIVDLVSLSEEDIAGFANTLAEDAFKKHKEVTKSVEAFKTQLGTFIQQIGESTEDEDKKKLIIFVDELDRCRPTYAVEVLECIKHLFNIPGVVFVLAVDVDQLKATIAKTYGAPDDGEGYLRKFIDWQLKLPKPSPRQFCEFLYQSFNLKETEKFTTNGNWQCDQDFLLDGVALVADTYGLSLRTLSQVFTDINLAVRTLPEHQPSYSFPLGCIAALRHVKEIRNLRDCFKLGESQNGLIKSLSSNIQRKDPLNGSMRIISDIDDILKAIFMHSNEFNKMNKEWNELNKAATSFPSMPSADGQPISRRDQLGYVLGAYTDVNKGRSDQSLSVAEAVFMQIEKTSFLVGSP